MRHNKRFAIKLRFKGYSYGEINKTLKIPKSTLSGWLSHLQISDIAQKRIQSRTRIKSITGLIKRNKHQTKLAQERATKIHFNSSIEINRISKEQLKLIGAALYWAEGYKRPVIRNGHVVTHHSVALTNSDPKLIVLFLKFLREVCDVPNTKIKADIRIFEHMNERELLTFWVRATGLPMENFGKTYYGISRLSKGKRPFNRLPHGTIMIRVGDTKLFHKIMGWIDGLAFRAS